jgi:hypothetical protein
MITTTVGIGIILITTDIVLITHIILTIIK